MIALESTSAAKAAIGDELDIAALKRCATLSPAGVEGLDVRRRSLRSLRSRGGQRHPPLHKT
jgi:hypothetical protein